MNLIKEVNRLKEAKAIKDKSYKSNLLAFIQEQEEDLLSILQDKEYKEDKRSFAELFLDAAKYDAKYADMMLELYLTEENEKVRKKIMVGIGKLKDAKYNDFLSKHLPHEDSPYVKIAIIDALGKIGFTKWTDSDIAQSKEENGIGRALQKAIRRTHQLEDIRLERPLGKYYLYAYPGLENFVIEELPNSITNAKKVAPGCISIDANQTDFIEKLRTITSDFYCHDAIEQDIDELIEKGIVHIMQMKPTVYKNTLFRLSIPKQSTQKEYVSKTTQLSKLIEQKFSWKNSPSNYDVEIQIKKHTKGQYVFLWRDRRWSKVKRNLNPIPASMNPSVAAALSLLVQRKINENRQGEDQINILDPCCGAGTLLYELSHIDLPENTNIFGQDISKKHLKACKKNIKNTTPTIQVQTGDMEQLHQSFSKHYFDVIITNLPFGIRLKSQQSNNQLYAKFAKNIDQVLKPSGFAVLYTADYKALELAFKPYDGNLTKINTIFAGSLPVSLFVYE